MAAAAKRRLSLLLVKENFGDRAHRVAEMMVQYDHTIEQLEEEYSATADAA